MHVANANVAEFAVFLQMSILDRPVVDLTGLGDNNHWSFELKWQDNDTQAAKIDNASAQPPPDNGESLLPLPGAMAKELGLDLKSGKTPVRVMVIDHIERPSAN